VEEEEVDQEKILTKDLIQELKIFLKHQKEMAGLLILCVASKKYTSPFSNITLLSMVISISLES
jgi:hypothetical protein